MNIYCKWFAIKSGIMCEALSSSKLDSASVSSSLVSEKTLFALLKAKNLASTISWKWEGCTQYWHVKMLQRLFLIDFEHDFCRRKENISIIVGCQVKGKFEVMARLSKKIRKLSFTDNRLIGSSVVICGPTYSVKIKFRRLSGSSKLEVILLLV